MALRGRGDECGHIGGSGFVLTAAGTCNFDFDRREAFGIGVEYVEFYRCRYRVYRAIIRIAGVSLNRLASTKLVR